MRWFRWHHRAWHHRIAELDRRIGNAQEGARSAAREAELSVLRQERIRKDVVMPLRRAGEHNQFADLIRKTLIIPREEE